MSQGPDDLNSIDVLVVGAGAAGLMAAIWAGRTRPGARVVVVDSARKIGAKILISGGGRCNVTHHEVDARSFHGSSRNAIGKILKSFDVRRTVTFFDELGVELVREDTGKLFPSTHRAQTVLEALLGAAKDCGVELRHPFRVSRVVCSNSTFVVEADEDSLECTRVIFATGGKSIPKSGSDGHGYEMVRALGHTVTRTFPALVPLTLPPDHYCRSLSGISTEAILTVVSGQGKRSQSVRGPVLCTHFGLSGPAALDVSRHLASACADDPDSHLIVNWLPHHTAESLEDDWKRSVSSIGIDLKHRLPSRLALALCHHAGIDPEETGRNLPRQVRRSLVASIVAQALPITGDRGFNFAEVTAGGVPLSEIRLSTMESRVCPGLYLCGEICDVDGRIGGFNFQWAWSSGYVAGRAAAAMVS